MVNHVKDAALRYDAAVRDARRFSLQVPAKFYTMGIQRSRINCKQWRAIA